MRGKKDEAVFFLWIEIIYIIQLLKIGSKGGVVQQEERLPKEPFSEQFHKEKKFHSVKNLKKI